MTGAELSLGFEKSFEKLDCNGCLGLKNWTAPEEKPVYCDFLSPSFVHRLKTFGRKHILVRALSRSEPSIMDATAGLGYDAVTFAYLGYTVTAVESHPLVYELFADGLKRLKSSPWGVEIAHRIQLINEDAVRVLESSSPQGQVYLDPMFEIDRKGRRPRKEMRWLAELTNSKHDMAALLEASRKKARRVILKQPHRSPSLQRLPSHSFRGSTVRYDVFLS